MLLSSYFLPTLKENPIDATVASHQLMIRAGMIRQTSSGIYSWLPLGLRVLRKVERIIRDEMNKSGAQEILMPTIQPAELWIESGRYDAYGKEMLRIKDRHERDLLYGPTHEEVITDLFRKNISSYKDLPKNLYQIHWKFRDEIRPRFGLMRGREFLMKDSYSFDIDEASAKVTYNLMYETYFKIFLKMGLKPIALKADTGAIGGDLSHEFHILAEVGESAIYYDKKFDKFFNNDSEKSDQSIHKDNEKVDIKKIFKAQEQEIKIDFQELQSIYAMADDLHIADKCPISNEDLASKRGIEVGQIFNFGLKYSKSMQASVMASNGEKIYPNMGSYGIGVSRVVAGAIEANHDENGIIWPKQIAPFEAIIINVKSGDKDCDKFCENLYQKFLNNNIDVLYDDTKNSLGQKLAIADLIGIPTQIIVGPKSIENKVMEIKDRRSGKKIQIRYDSISDLG
jgi:prolyl-tRNA synthetase